MLVCEFEFCPKTQLISLDEDKTNVNMYYWGMYRH